MTSGWAPRRRGWDGQAAQRFGAAGSCRDLRDSVTSPTAEQLLSPRASLWGARSSGHHQLHLNLCGGLSAGVPASCRLFSVRQLGGLADMQAQAPQSERTSPSAVLSLPQGRQSPLSCPPLHLRAALQSADQNGSFMVACMDCGVAPIVFSVPSP